MVEDGAREMEARAGGAAVCPYVCGCGLRPAASGRRSPGPKNQIDLNIGRRVRAGGVGGRDPVWVTPAAFALTALHTQTSQGTRRFARCALENDNCYRFASCFQNSSQYFSFFLIFFKFFSSICKSFKKSFIDIIYIVLYSLLCPQISCGTDVSSSPHPCAGRAGSGAGADAISR